MTIAENIETTRMSLSSLHKSPENAEQKQSRMKSRTSEPPQSTEKAIKFSSKKEKAKISPKEQHDSVEEKSEDETEEKPPPDFKNFINDKK